MTAAGVLKEAADCGVCVNLNGGRLQLKAETKPPDESPNSNSTKPRLSRCCGRRSTKLQARQPRGRRGGLSRIRALSGNRHLVATASRHATGPRGTSCSHNARQEWRLSFGKPPCATRHGYLVILASNWKGSLGSRTIYSACRMALSGSSREITPPPLAQPWRSLATAAFGGQRHDGSRSHFRPAL